ncbi:MAG: sigma 54-interacting transcriptional regulator [Deltaproteobacteria bacterium]|nr:sigma 54-interacting transcriptional regulator [Deltaproteobacteria bacterium]MBN2672099.1 sigma 54-interacting transcriptional regulator [Deltaproteobacteria bacterium]
MSEVSQLYPLIVESIHDGVFTVDESFRITSFNAAAEKIIGIKREEAIGKNCHEVFRTNICQKKCALRQTIETGKPAGDVRINALNAQMETVPLEISTAVLKDNDGKLLGGVEIFRDLSQEELLRSELSDRHMFEDMVGRSKAMEEIFALLPNIADADIPVLVRGPSGTGKELVASAIHNLSRRSNKPFIRVNCGALPDTLLESELFGYERGAFTGAMTPKPGRFAQADGGTLFLDEIGDISPAFQIKLLRALEEGEIQPLGSTKTIQVNVRLVCATNRNLEKLVDEGVFREDLYYRIRVVPIDIPALKDRKEDIPFLIEHFTRRISAKLGRKAKPFSPKTLRCLYDYDYPGNIRELRNILERAFVLCKNASVQPHSLPLEVRLACAGDHTTADEALPSTASHEKQIPTHHRSYESASKSELRTVLDDVGWNREKAAKRLQISRTTLWRRMKDEHLA